MSVGWRRHAARLVRIFQPPDRFATGFSRNVLGNPNPDRMARALTSISAICAGSI